MASENVGSICECSADGKEKSPEQTGFPGQNITTNISDPRLSMNLDPGSIDPAGSTGPGSIEPRPGLRMVRTWKGTCEDSWAKIVPPRPQVLDWKQESGLLTQTLRRAHDESYLTEYNVKKGLITTAMAGDANQKVTQENLSQRCMSLHSFIKLLEDAIDRLDQGIGVLQNRKQRLTSALLGVHKVNSINSECLHIRSLRMEDDHLGDEPYKELIQENNLIKDLEKLMNDTMLQIQDQIKTNIAIKNKLQLDWSHKSEAFEIDSHNLSLNINQSTPTTWENYTKANLNEAEQVLASSADLISYLDGPILSQYVKEVREQADKVNNALASKVCSVDKTRETFEYELQKVVSHLGETETVIGDLKNIIQNLEKALKVAQTRLGNRLQRVGIESCKDAVQAGLLEEVKCLTGQISDLMAKLSHAQNTQNGLIYARNKLEYEIQVKRKSILQDNERCTRIRQHYPALVTLSGH